MSDRMDQFKKQYESIKAPEDLIMKANKEIKKSKAKRGFKTGIGAAAAFVAVSYTHLDVYKRQATDFLLSRKW